MSTIAYEHCDRCPGPWDWPVKNMVNGCCPRCGKADDRAWRFAAARRLILRRERETKV
jgi:hypothetical protein